jgi:mono/diheme cytochrome c family protein
LNTGKIITTLILMGLLLVLVACEGGELIPSGEEEPGVHSISTETPLPELFGHSLRGGLLYDTWWKAIGINPPAGDQPLWATQTTNTSSGEATWRCKECHGWDYKGADGAYGSGSHYTGFPGIIHLAGKDPQSILAALKGSTNPDHDFSGVMNEQALIDLALFISMDLLDYSKLVSEDKVALIADSSTGEELFQDTCSLCHGVDGSLINFGTAQEPEYLGDLASDNPWEVLHKARFGQPGVDKMPSVIDAGWTIEEQGALLAYVQTLEPSSDLGPLGGLIYDNWWNALGLNPPAGDQPLWATQTTNTSSGEATWRCKECHGWDYKGADGAYGSGSHYTGFPGILGAAEYSSTQLIAWLDGTNNPDHDFSQYLDANAFAALARFVQVGTVDMSNYINYGDLSAIGDASAGQALFGTRCAPCHGLDGASINFGDDAAPLYLGGLAKENPWEVLHKAANGQPGSIMPSGLSIGWSWEDLANVLAFLQTLEQ